MTLVRLGRIDEAIGAYDEALRLIPSNAHALYGRGLAKRKKGDLTASDADLAAARTISSGWRRTECDPENGAESLGARSTS
jgi:tetratricopeptide (TPR) repeat protein